MKILVKKVPPEKIKELEIENWPVWTSPVTEFDWFYDEPETCYFVEGKVEVTGGEGQTRIGAGDLVVFPKGLKCVWKVLEPVKKYYKFFDLSRKV